MFQKSQCKRNWIQLAADAPVWDATGGIKKYNPHLNIMIKWFLEAGH
jgi:hypothetical protein